MKIDQHQKEMILSNRISYQNVVDWNAFEVFSDAKDRIKNDHAEELGIDDVNDETQFMRWVGLDKNESVPLADIFAARQNPHFLLWLLLRPELIPASVLHLWAVHFCRDFHKRLSADSVYIDFRYEALLDVKEQWAMRKASLGNLTHAQRKSSEILSEIPGSNDEKMIAGAAATHAALNKDGRISILSVFRSIDSVYELKRENVRRFKSIRESLLN